MVLNSALLAFSDYFKLLPCYYPKYDYALEMVFICLLTCLFAALICIIVAAKWLNVLSVGDGRSLFPDI